MASIPSSFRTFEPSDDSLKFENLPDWRKLRKAIAEPVSEIIVAEVESPGRARRIVELLAKALPNRLQTIVDFSTTNDDPNGLLQSVLSRSAECPPQLGTIFLIDGTKEADGPEESRAIAFWRGMNMLRERWEAVNGQIVIFLRPHNYRLLSSHADHLKRWIPVKLHLIPKVLSDFVSSGELIELRRQSMAAPNARRSLEVLETQLAAALTRDEPASTLTTRYYIPMFLAAVDAGDISRARDIHDKLHNAQIPSVLFPDWSRAITAFNIETGNITAATRAAELYLKWALASKNKYHEAAARFLFGVLWLVRKKPSEAETWLKKSLDLFREVGAKQQVCRVYGELGIVADRLGNLADAEAHFRNALRLAEEEQDAHAIAITYQHLATLFAERGDMHEAEHWFKKSLEAAEAIENPDLLASALHNLAVFAKKQGKMEEMEEWRRKFDKVQTYRTGKLSG